MLNHSLFSECPRIQDVDTFTNDNIQSRSFLSDMASVKDSAWLGLQMHGTTAIFTKRKRPKVLTCSHSSACLIGLNV